jgi:hypothetical protein
MKRIFFICILLISTCIAVSAIEPVTAIQFKSFTNKSYAAYQEREKTPSTLDILPAKSKSPFLAGMFSLIIPGIGQCYAGDFTKGLSIFAATGVLGVLSYLTLLGSPEIAIILFAAGCSLWIWSVVDAIKIANRTKINIANGIYLDFKPSIQPVYTFNNYNNLYGMKLSINF